jgi:IclR family transcriptional regulator, acetate operon repressor
VTVSNAPAGPASEQRLSAIGKLVAVVEVLATENKVSRIARATGLPTSTVHRILQGLVQAGWAQQDEYDGYLLGARLLAITARADDASFLAQKAVPFLRELRDATGDTVHLATRDGDEMLYVAKLDGRKAYHMRSHVGLTVPMHCSAVGKAILAAIPVDEVRETVTRTGLQARTDRTLSDLDALLADLQTVRTRGYSLDDQENETNIRCVGAVITGPRGLPVAGVSVSSLKYDLSGARVGQYAQLVITAARQISRALGSPLASSPPLPSGSAEF